MPPKASAPGPAEKAAEALMAIINPDGSGKCNKEQWEKAFASIGDDTAISRKAWEGKFSDTGLFDLIPKKNKAALSAKEWATGFGMVDRDQDGTIDLKDLAASRNEGLTAAGLAAAGGALKEGTGTKEGGSSIDPQVVEIYSKMYADNGGDKAKVCAALGLEEAVWTDKCKDKDGFLAAYLGVTKKAEAVKLSDEVLAEKGKGLKKVGTKEIDCKVDPQVVDMYKKIHADNKGDKEKICAALGLSEKEWTEKCKDPAGFVAVFLGAKA